MYAGVGYTRKDAGQSLENTLRFYVNCHCRVVWYFPRGDAFNEKEMRVELPDGSLVCTSYNQCKETGLHSCEVVLSEAQMGKKRTKKAEPLFGVCAGPNCGREFKAEETKFKCVDCNDAEYCDRCIAKCQCGVESVHYVCRVVEHACGRGEECTVKVCKANGMTHCPDHR